MVNLKLLILLQAKPLMLIHQHWMATSVTSTVNQVTVKHIVTLITWEKMMVISNLITVLLVLFSKPQAHWIEQIDQN